MNTEEGEGGVTVAPEHPGETERTAKKIKRNERTKETKKQYNT